MTDAQARTFDQAGLDALIAAHALWLHGDAAGRRFAVPHGVFRGLDFRSADLRGAIAHDADFSAADMAGVDLRGADVRHATFLATAVAGMRLADARTDAADFSGSDLGGTDRPYSYRMPSCNPLAADGPTRTRDLIVLMGVSGAGKSTVARVLARRLGGRAMFDCEQRAFNRRFIFGVDRKSEALHDAVVEHCASLVAEWARTAPDIVVVDRWYETYFSDLGLHPSRIAAIEDAISGAGFRGRLVHLVIAQDLVAMARRLAHTKAQRPDAWWIDGDTVEGVAAKNLACQDRTRRLADVTRLDYREIDTTDMRWERIADEVLRGIDIDESESAA